MSRHIVTLTVQAAGAFVVAVGVGVLLAALLPVAVGVGAGLIVCGACAAVLGATEER